MIRTVLPVLLVAQLAAFSVTQLAVQEVDRVLPDDQSQPRVVNPQGSVVAEPLDAMPLGQLRTDAARDSITAMFLAPGATGRLRTTDTPGLPQPLPQEMSGTSKATVIVLCVLLVGAIAFVAVAAAIGSGLGAG